MVNHSLHALEHGVIGRAHRIQMLESFIFHALSYSDLTFERMDTVAQRL